MKNSTRFWILNLIIMAAMVAAHRLYGAQGMVLVGTVVGTQLDFGVKADQQSLTTQRVNMSHKKDMKEAKNKSGDTIAVSFYNETQEVTVEGLGTGTGVPGASLALTTPPLTGINTFYITENSVDTGNEDFVKTTTKAKAWKNVA